MGKSKTKAGQPWGTEPCKACAARTAAGFSGQCPSCASERTRKERADVTQRRADRAYDPESHDRVLAWIRAKDFRAVPALHKRYNPMPVMREGKDGSCRIYDVSSNADDGPVVAGMTWAEVWNQIATGVLLPPLRPLSGKV